MRQKRNVWFWVALVAILTNRALIEVFLVVLQQGLRLLGLH